MESLPYLLMDSEPRSDVLHGCVQQVHTQNLEISQKAALLAPPPLPRGPEIASAVLRSLGIC